MHKVVQIIIPVRSVLPQSITQRSIELYCMGFNLKSTRWMNEFSQCVESFLNPEISVIQSFNNRSNKNQTSLLVSYITSQQLHQNTFRGLKIVKNKYGLGPSAHKWVYPKSLCKHPESDKSTDPIYLLWLLGLQFDKSPLCCLDTSLRPWQCVLPIGRNFACAHTFAPFAPLPDNDETSVCCWPACGTPGLVSTPRLFQSAPHLTHCLDPCSLHSTLRSAPYSSIWQFSPPPLRRVAAA